MIEDRDFVYLDAGDNYRIYDRIPCPDESRICDKCCGSCTKTGCTGKSSISYRGELKSSTEAVIGAQAMETLERYHFTKGFFGANGISRNEGFTTPDAGEAQVKGQLCVSAGSVMCLLTALSSETSVLSHLHLLKQALFLQRRSWKDIRQERN